MNRGDTIVPLSLRLLIEQQICFSIIDIVSNAFQVSNRYIFFGSSGVPLLPKYSKVQYISSICLSGNKQSN